MGFKGVYISRTCFPDDSYPNDSYPNESMIAKHSLVLNDSSVNCKRTREDCNFILCQKSANKWNISGRNSNFEKCQGQKLTKVQSVSIKTIKYGCDCWGNVVI